MRKYDMQVLNVKSKVDKQPAESDGFHDKLWI